MTICMYPLVNVHLKKIPCVLFVVSPTLFRIKILYWKAYPVVSVVKNPPANAGDPSSIPGSGRSPEVGNGNPLQYSCLGNSVDRGAW